MPIHPHPLHTSSEVVLKMKEKGNLVKYFEGISRDHGGLLLNRTWLDPWVVAKMLRLLFAPAIKRIVAGALALAAAAAARTLLRQAHEEAEVQDAVEDEQEKRDVERAAQRKEKNRIQKKEKRALTDEEEKEQKRARQEQKRARQEQKRVRQQQKALTKRDRRVEKARLKAEKKRRWRNKGRATGQEAGSTAAVLHLKCAKITTTWSTACTTHRTSTWKTRTALSAMRMKKRSRYLSCAKRLTPSSTIG
jgi:hypothetical protein